IPAPEVSAAPSSARRPAALVALADRHLHRESFVQLRVDRDAVRDRGLLDLPDAAGAGDERRKALIRTQRGCTQTDFRDALSFVTTEASKTRCRSRERVAIAVEVPDRGDPGHPEDAMLVCDPREMHPRVAVLSDQLDGRKARDGLSRGLTHELVVQPV